MESVREYSRVNLERTEVMLNLAIEERKGKREDVELDEAIKLYELERDVYKLIIKRINDLLEYIRNIFITM